MVKKQHLLVSVRGRNEAIAAAKGGAHIADVEYPISALGTPYPLNIQVVRNELNRLGFTKVLVSTNIGEKQSDRATACQAALGVAIAGVDIVKCGLAELPYEAAVYLGRNLVNTMRSFFPKKTIIPAVFVDRDMCRYFDPFIEGPKLVSKIKADGLLLDTYNKLIGKGLLDYCSIEEIKEFVKTCHYRRKEAWIAGSIQLRDLPDLWATGVDVICVRQAACQQSGKGRFGKVRAKIVAKLVSTIPRKK